MRRLLALFVVAVLGAGVYGISGASSGLAVDGSRVSASTLRSELAAIAASPTLTCHVEALAQAGVTTGAGGDAIAASSVAAWGRLRVEGLAIQQFVAHHFLYRATPYRLSVARSSLEAEMTQAVTATEAAFAQQGHSFVCPGTSAQALAAMPREMLNAQLTAQAASLYLIAQMNSTIPLTTASLHAYFDAHASSYDTVCISVALVGVSQVTTFVTAIKSSGLSVAALSRKYTVDPKLAATGGAYGCFGPTSSVYATVLHDVGTTPVGQYDPTPQSVSLGGATYALFVAPTKRSATPFAIAAPAVYAAVQSLNATAAGNVKKDILFRAAVAVDPAFGRWALVSGAATLTTPGTPNSADVTGSAVLAGTTPATYK